MYIIYYKTYTRQHIMLIFISHYNNCIKSLSFKCNHNYYNKVPTVNCDFASTPDVFVSAVFFFFLSFHRINMLAKIIFPMKYS